jgi:hypothetical protein
MNKNQKFIKVFTLSGIAISGAFFLMGCYALWKNRDYEMANHSFLFGTQIEGILLRNKILFSVIGSLPLVLPVFFKKNILNVILMLLGVALFFFLQHVFFIISD